MTDTRIAKLMWDAYAIQAGWDSFDGKPLPAWDELGEDRQSCWVAAASVTASRIEKLEAALREIHEVYAGSEGIPEPMTAAEGYLLRLLTEMVGVTRNALEGEDDPAS